MLGQDVLDKGLAFNESIDQLNNSIQECENIFDFSPEAVNILYTFSDLLKDVHTTQEVFFNQFRTTFLE